MRHLVAVLLVLAGCGGKNNVERADLSPPDLAPWLMVDMAAPKCQILKPLGQQGCPAGYHCSVGTLDGEPNDLCFPVPTQSQMLREGDTCVKIELEGDRLVGDWCEPGTTCVAAAGLSKCRKYCFERKDCAAGSACVGVTGSPTFKKSTLFGEAYLQVCVKDDKCDPVTNSGCAGATRCLISRSDDVSRIFLCTVADGTREPQAVCSASTQCAPGVMCAGLGFCRRVCYRTPTSAVGTCPSNEGTCHGFFGSGDYGRCE
jgi:hypothetical protein